MANAIKEYQELLAIKDTELFNWQQRAKNGETNDSSPLLSPPTAIEAAKRKGTSLVNPRLRR